MTTKFGLAYKGRRMEEHAGGALTGGNLLADGHDREEDIANAQAGVNQAGTDVTTLLQMLLEDRRRHEEEMAVKRAHREEDMEKRVGEMKEQMDEMLKLVERTAKGKTNSGEALVKVAKLMDSDDIEEYLLTFERQMAAYEIDQSRWAFILAPQLTGRAQKAYMALTNDDTSDYPTIKQAILKRYDINEETHRPRLLLEGWVTLSQMGAEGIWARKRIRCAASFASALSGCNPRHCPRDPSGRTLGIN